MALISCPECDADVSSLAPLCPKCGYPLLAINNENDKKSIIMSSPDFLVGSRSTKQISKNVSGKLFIGILLCPYIFSWATFQRGYSTASRVISISWMLLLLLSMSGGSSTSFEKTNASRISSPHKISNAYTSYGLSNSDLAWHAAKTFGWNCNSVVSRGPQTGGFYFITCGNGKRLRVYPRANKHPRITNENGGWN